MSETGLALPDEAKFKTDIQAINRFQQVVHANLVQGQDFGVIPGTNKPTLLKPGAEKITKLLGLCDHYEILDRQEDWKGSFFRYLVKCQLKTASDGLVVSEGFGECNSMESKYRYRWLWPKEIPENFDRDNAVKRSIKTKNGYVTQYRIDNEDIFTQVNTLIKMAKKRSLVDAALSAGRLSNVFTQDIEDIADQLKADIEPEVKENKEELQKTQESPESIEPSSPTGKKVQNVAELKGLLMKHKIPTQEAYEILSINRFMDLVDLDEAWAKIKEAKGIE
jgi:hypothetical protein